MNSWFVLYSKSRHEKVLQFELEKLNIITFLPIIKVKSQRKDRIKTIEKPLFNSYIFINEFPNIDKLRFLRGFSKIVKHENKPAKVHQQEIDNLKVLIKSGFSINVLEDSKIKLLKGDKVEIISGKLEGFKGELIENSEGKSVKISFEEFNSALIINIKKSQLKKIENE